jgi:hypothetical protein
VALERKITVHPHEVNERIMSVFVTNESRRSCRRVTKGRR